MDKRALTLFTVFFVAGMLFMGNGITGLYMAEFKQKACEGPLQCAGDETCCNFYNEKFGVCDRQENCDAIARFTFDERRKVSTYDAMETSEKYQLFNMAGAHIEGPQKASRLYSMLAGVLLVLVALIGFFIGKVRDIHAGKSHSLYRTKEHRKKR